MVLKGDRITIVTVAEGTHAADAAALAADDGIVEVYRNVRAADLPMTLGRWASSDVITGLQMVAKNDQPTASFDPDQARDYLASLNVVSQSSQAA